MKKEHKHKWVYIDTTEDWYGEDDEIVYTKTDRFYCDKCLAKNQITEEIYRKKKIECPTT